jgi:hypothetical protein
LNKNQDKISYQPRMTGIFKSRPREKIGLMKHLGFVLILLLLGMGLTSNGAIAALTASQRVPSPVAVGETVMVTVMLTYNGANSTQAVVTPFLPWGVSSGMLGGQTIELYPMATQPISYPVTADQSGTYMIVSQIEYAEDGTWRDLRLEAPFTAIDRSMPEPNPAPGEGNPGEAEAPPEGYPPMENPPQDQPPMEKPPGDGPVGGEPPALDAPTPGADNPPPGDNQSPPA